MPDIEFKAQSLSFTLIKYIIFFILQPAYEHELNNFQEVSLLNKIGSRAFNE